MKLSGPITGEEIAKKVDLTRATLRPDLAILTMSGILDAKPRVGYFYCNKASSNAVSNELMKMHVDEVKSLPVVVESTISIYDTIVKMFCENIGSLYVVDEQNFLQGVVSRKDLLRYSLGSGSNHDIPISVVMTRMPNIIMVSPEETVYNAIKKIIEHEVDSLPLTIATKTEENGKMKTKYEVVGRFTKTNIAKLFIEMSEGI